MGRGRYFIGPPPLNDPMGTSQRDTSPFRRDRKKAKASSQPSQEDLPKIEPRQGPKKKDMVSVIAGGIVAGVVVLGMAYIGVFTASLGLSHPVFAVVVGIAVALVILVAVIVKRRKPLRLKAGDTEKETHSDE